MREGGRRGIWVGRGRGRKKGKNDKRKARKKKGWIQEKLIK